MDFVNPKWGNATSEVHHVEFYSREVMIMKSNTLEKHVRKKAMNHLPNIRVKNNECYSNKKITMCIIMSFM
jgi:hypothetical protein